MTLGYSSSRVTSSVAAQGGKGRSRYAISSARSSSTRATASCYEQTAFSYGDLRRYADEEAMLDRALAIEPNNAETKVLHA